MRDFKPIFGVFTIVGCVVATATNWYADNWCGGSLQFLDDSKCIKQFPKSYDRDWQCEIPASRVIPGSDYQLENTLNKINVDVNTLQNVMTDSRVNICAILTKRVAKSDGDVALYNKYLCAGNYSATVGFETWSSSKIFAMANAAGHLRTSESCSADSSNYGVDGKVTGKHGSTPLGDLATVVCSYDHTAGYTSNSLSSYFHDIGWRDRINGLVNGSSHWLGATQGATPQTLGGNYGEASPSDLTLSVTSATNSASVCAADKDPWPTKHDNTISALSAAELTRRLVQHRDLTETLRFPGVTWEDIKTILYGAETSQLFPGLQWGGMTSDTAVFLQTALNLPEYLKSVNTNDQWRIFSKLGAGWSTSRYVGEIVTNAYTCLPSFDESGVASGGIEFTLTARGSVPNDASLVKVEKAVMDAVTKVVQYIMTHEK